MSSSEWKTYKLGKVCSKIGSGATPRGGQEAYLNSGEYALIRSQNVLDFTFSYNGLAYINEDQANKLNSVALEDNDVLLNITGDSVARVCQVPNTLLPARVNQHVAIIRPQKDILDNFFLKYYLLNPNFKNLLLNISSVGATRNAITKGMIEDLEISAPDLKTQQRIASILSSLDVAIELNQQINKTLEEMAKAIFKEWFVAFNFPNATGKFQETEIGKIPFGWKLGKLGDIYKTTSGGTPSRAKLEYYKNGIYQWVKSKELNNSFLIDTEEKITEDALKKSSAKLVPKYSVLIAMYGATVGEIGIISNEATCNQAICAFLPNIDYPFSFIYQFLLLNKQDIISQAVGSAQQNISQQLLLNYSLAIPPAELVKAFHKLVEPLFFQIEQNVEENQSLSNLRDTLLPKLMKGEININL